MSDDDVDPETVDHVAGLARIDLEERDRERFAEQFAEILAHFEMLDEVPEVDTDPELTNVMRADEIEQSLDREATLQNTPDDEDGYFKGPPVS